MHTRLVTKLAKQLMKYGKQGDVYMVVTDNYSTFSFYDNPPKKSISWRIRANTVKTMAGASKVAAYLLDEYCVGD